MAQLHRLKIKVTFRSHGIYPSIRVCSISPELFERFSFNFTQMFLSVRWCAEAMTQLCRLKVKATLQSHGILPLNVVSFKSPQPFVRFSLNITQMFLSVSWCAEPMTRLCKLKVKLDHTSRSWDSAVGIWLSFRLLSCLFLKQIFQKVLSGIPSDCQTVCIC